MSEETAATPEITIEGNAASQVTEALPQALDVTKKAVEKKLPNKPQSRKQTSDQNKKFFEIGTLTLNLTNVGPNWSEIVWDPYTAGGKGAAFNLPFRRMLNFSGSRDKKGYSTTIAVTFIVSCPPQVSGYIEIVDSFLQTNRVFFDLTTRGEITSVPMALTLLPASGYPLQARHYLQPQQKVSQAKIGFRYRISNMNRTADIADIKMTYTANLGETTFDRPVKPRPRGTASTQAIMQELMEMISLNQHSDVEHIVDELADQVDHGEMYDVDGDFDEENIHSTYLVPIYDELTNVGDTIVIPLDLTVKLDTSSNSDESTLTQPWERYAHGFCSRNGDYGPVAGKYVINVRVGTQTAGQIEHIALPGDEMGEIFATRILGLSSILDFAGSALSGIGGPLIGGFLNTATNAVGNLLGMGSADNQPTQQAQPYQITGDIPVSRYPAFIKPIAENFAEDPVFGGLLMKLTNFFDAATSRAVTQLPVQVFAKMDGMRFDRLVTNRTITPRSTIAEGLRLPLSEVPDLVLRMGQLPDIYTFGTDSNILYTKLLKCCSKKLANRTIMSTSIGFDEFQATEVSETECRDVATIRSFKKLQFKHL